MDVSFLGGATLDNTLISELLSCGSLDSGALESFLELTSSFLSFSDATSLQRAFDNLCSTHELKQKTSKAIIRSLIILLGGAVKFGVTEEALGVDLKAIGEP